jgi:hypothetical protein
MNLNGFCRHPFTAGSISCSGISNSRRMQEPQHQSIRDHQIKEQESIVHFHRQCHQCIIIAYLHIGRFILSILTSTYSQYRVPVSLSRCSQVSTSPLVLSYLIHELANVMNPCAFWPLQISTACTSQHTSHVHSFFATRRIIFKVDPFHTQVLNRSCVTGILWFHSCRRKLREIPRGRWRRASASMWSAGNLQEGSSQSRRVWSVNTNLYTLTDAPT